MYFLAKVFQPAFFLCKNTLRALILSSWFEYNKGTTRSIVLEQLQNKSEVSLNKCIWLLLIKSVTTLNQVQALSFLFSFICQVNRFSSSIKEFFFTNSMGWYIACMANHLYILPCASHQFLLALSYFSGCNV